MQETAVMPVMPVIPEILQFAPTPPNIKFRSSVGTSAQVVSEGLVVNFYWGLNLFQTSHVAVTLNAVVPWNRLMSKLIPFFMPTNQRNSPIWLHRYRWNTGIYFQFPRYDTLLRKVRISLLSFTGADIYKCCALKISSPMSSIILRFFFQFTDSIVW